MIIKSGKEIPFEDVLYRIEYAEHTEIEEIVHAIRRRFSRIHPGWELLLFTLQTGNDAECTRQINDLVEFLSAHYLKKT